MTAAETIHLYDDADLAWRRSGPTERALRALDVRVDDVRRMPGGAGYNWTDGRVVLKPVGNVPEHSWVCEVFAAWMSTDWATGDDWDQLLVRALLYRLGPTGFIASRNRLMGSLVTHVERARPVVDAVLARLPS